MSVPMRTCPSCDKEIKYTCLDGYKEALKRARPCRSCSLKARRPSDQCIEASRQVRLGKPLSPEHIEAIKIGNTGLKRSEETLLKMSLWQIGKIIPIESKIKMSIAAKNRPPISEETRKKHRLKLIGRKNPMYGKNHTEETKNKISEHHKKFGISCGTSNSMYGKKHTEKTKFKISKKAKERMILHPNSNHCTPLQQHVQDKITKIYDEKNSLPIKYLSYTTSQFATWSKKIKARIPYCENCFSVDNLEAHHVIPRNRRLDLALDLGNGITLCYSCHKYHHIICGY